MLCQFEITKAGGSPAMWAFGLSLMSFFTASFVHWKSGVDVDGHKLLRPQDLPPLPQSAAPNTGELRAAHQFPLLIFLNKLLFVSKRINSLTPNAKQKEVYKQRWNLIEIQDEHTRKLQEYELNSKAWLDVCPKRCLCVGGKVRRSLCKRSRSKSSPLLTNLAA